MNLPTITPATIMTYATEQSYDRGEEYASEGAVTQVSLRGNSISALVEGSEYAPYEVQITFTPTTILSASCTCPYDLGGWCKHIVAVLIVCQEMPEMVEEHPPIEERIQSLSRDHLHDLVLSIADHYPSTLAHIERMAMSYQPSGQKDHKKDDQTASSAPTSQAQDNIAGWQAYVDDLKDRHGRKYKLMGLLQRIA